MRWHKYSEEKPKPLEVYLIKYFYDKNKFGESKPQYMLCKYSNLGEESSEPWTELNGEAETYWPDYSEYWLSVSEIEDCMELEEKYICDECGRENDHPNTLFYKKKG